jgi:hypothetical protein
MTTARITGLLYHPTALARKFSGTKSDANAIPK